MSRRRVLVAALLLGLAAAAGLPAQAALYPLSPEVVELERLYRLSGRVLPSAGYPVFPATLAGWAAGLAAGATDPAASAEARGGALSFEPGLLEIAIRNRFSLEGYLRAGSPWAEPEFGHEYLEREPMYELTLYWGRADRAAIVAQGFLHREYLGYSDWNLPGATSGNPVALENRHVSKGYFWYNFDPLQLELGRDVVHFGPLRSSLLPSDRLPFMDLLRLTLPLGRLTMDFMVSSLENVRTAEEAAVDPDPNGLGYSFAEDGTPGVTAILANLHRFEYDFGCLRAAVSGLCVFAREDNAFVLSDFFPVFSWHAGDVKPNNLSLIFDLEAVPFPGFRVMAQFGFDDISTEALGVGDSAIPTIFAGIAGLQYTRPLGFAVLDLYAEGGWTHYLWGSFNDKWYLGRAIFRLDLDQENHALPLTSPYGPGAAWGLLEAALEDWGGFWLKLRAELVFRNPLASLTDLPYAAADAVAAADLEGALTIGGEVRFRPWQWLDLYLKPVFFYREAEGWLELTLGGTATLDWRRPVRAAAR